MSDLALLRVVAQRLAGPRPATPADVVGHLSALQGQDLPGAIRSVALRMADDAGENMVRDAFAAGDVVRSWPMRGTLHLVRPRELSWMLSLTRERMEAGATRRREQLGIDDALYERALALAVGGIEERGPLSRADLVDLWAPDGITAVPGRAYHLIALLAMREVIVQGPPHPSRAGEQLFTLFDRWIPDPIRLAREEALATWADRYFRGHGPATVPDFARWAGLPVTEARRGLAGGAAGPAAGTPGLARVVVDGVEYWMDPATPDLLADHRREAEELLLLPGFDELLLGYADRSATLPPRWAEAVVPGKNGVFRPTVVHRGVVIGTWARVGSGRGARIEATPFARFTGAQEAALARVSRGT